MVEKTVVIEFGSSYVRAGLSGDYYPRYSSSSQLRRCDTAQGEPKECRVLIIEKILEVRSIRDIVLTILLRELQVRSVSLQPDLFLPIVTTCEKSGLIIDIGAKESRCLAIYDRRVIFNSLRFANIGVNHCINTFKKQLTAYFTHDIDHDVSFQLFHKICFYPAQDITTGQNCSIFGEVALNPSKWPPQVGTVLPVRLRQDCTASLVLGNTEDEDIADECGGVVGLILHSLLACSRDCRKEVLKNMVFCGGGSVLPGVPEGICECLQQRATTEPQFLELLPLFRDESITIRPKETHFVRSSLAWIGGSIFGKLSTNDGLFFSAADLSEFRIDREIIPPRSSSSSSSSSSTGTSSLNGRDAQVGGSTPATSSQVKISSATATACLPVGAESVVGYRAPDWTSENEKEWMFTGRKWTPKQLSSGQRQVVQPGK